MWKMRHFGVVGEGARCRSELERSGIRLDFTASESVLRLSGLRGETDPGIYF